MNETEEYMMRQSQNINKSLRDSYYDNKKIID